MGRMGWNIGGITVAGRRLERHRRASRLLQPRHFLRRRKPLYWATAYPPSLGYYHTATVRQTQCTSLTHLDMTRTNATVRVCSLLRWLKILGEAVEEIFQCPSPAHTPPPEALAVESPSAPTAGWTSFLKPTVQPSMDLFKYGIGFFVLRKIRFVVLNVYILHVYTTTLLLWSVNAALMNENGFSWERITLTNSFLNSIPDDLAAAFLWKS